MAKSQIGGLHDAFASANSNLSLTPQGSGGYDLHPDTMAPRLGKKPQSPAQHAAVVKAGRTSAVKRGAAAGKGIHMGVK
ncbi:hypothetical protein UFOVP62_53 [uncultured Caudovirales phage]|uniref:Uncharacterized protein n=1 Tax=uncultured Caudovirales phage TaxID=2100421 RepID=A0A6J5KSX6_9CAUD|nr:hypothetical protein UFOVP62_53 [uncultured Caudovirales phage]